ncbi:hypothetical protein QUA13_05140 [Microcoleus sp. S28C3]
MPVPKIVRNRGISYISEGRRKREEGRRKREEGRRKEEVKCNPGYYFSD